MTTPRNTYRRVWPIEAGTVLHVWHGGALHEVQACGPVVDDEVPVRFTTRGVPVRFHVEHIEEVEE